MRRVGFYLEAIARLAREWGGHCVVCGSGWQLEFAHLKPTGVNGRGRGRSKRYHDIKAHPECYVLMCHDHHGEFDAGKTSGAEWGSGFGLGTETPRGAQIGGPGPEDQER